jgi:hypothetical protein
MEDILKLGHLDTCAFTFEKWNYTMVYEESNVGIIEICEGWPLLTVETEVNGDSKRTNERGPFLVGSLGLSRSYMLFQFRCPHRPASWITCL